MVGFPEICINITSFLNIIYAILLYNICVLAVSVMGFPFDRSFWDSRQACPSSLKSNPQEVLKNVLHWVVSGFHM